MRGLTVFITDLRNCKNEGDEKMRINYELANIRMKLKRYKSFDCYQRKKYLCKLVYMYLLGYKPDLGCNEAISLLSSNSYPEKKIGYLYISVLVSKDNELNNLINKSIENDLNEPLNMNFVDLALCYIANTGYLEMYHMFRDSILSILFEQKCAGKIKQACCLALVAFIKKNPDIHMQMSDRHFIHLLNDKSLGLVHTAISLIEMITQNNAQFDEKLLDFVATWLQKIISNQKDEFKEYKYYSVPAPWLTVKLLKFLQCFPYPEDITISKKIDNVIIQIMYRNSEPFKSDKIQHLNIRIAITIEAINLVMHYNNSPHELIKAANILAHMLNLHNANYRYLALETMASLAASISIKKHQSIILSTLDTELDISIKHKAIDLLYNMADYTNANEIISHMFTILPSIEYALKEGLVLKLAILSEKYAFENYIDNIIKLISTAGECVNEEVWFRLIQVVTNRAEVQCHAVQVAFEALKAKGCHENMVRLGGYLLGEFGSLIAADAESSPMVQVKLLESLYCTSDLNTRQLLLTAFVKLCNSCGEVKPHVLGILMSEKQQRSSNVELQQRALEYACLLKVAPSGLLAQVLEKMPKYKNEKNALKKVSFSQNIKPRQWLLHSPSNTRGSATVATITTTVTPTNNTPHFNVTRTPEISTTNPEIYQKQGPGTETKTNYSIFPGANPHQHTCFPLHTHNSINTSTGNYIYPDENTNVKVSNGNSEINRSIVLSPNNEGVANRLFETSIQITTPPNIIPETKGYNVVTTYINSAFPTESLSQQTSKVLAVAPASAPNCSMVSLTSRDSIVKLPFIKSLSQSHGLLHDDSIFQIGFKSAFKFNKGVVDVYFGNRSNESFQNFICHYNNSNQDNKLKLSSLPLKNTLQAQEQIQQTLQVECEQEFDKTVDVLISFTHLNVPYKIKSFLPLALNRFFQVAIMNREQFLEKWTKLEHQVQVLHKATLTMESENISNRLISYNFIPLPFIDENPSNFVSVLVVHTTQALCGVMMRIEADHTTKTYRLTVKSIKAEVASIVCSLLKLIL